MLNWMPMADRLVWANVFRPVIPLVYLDLNHYIYLARAREGGNDGTPTGYARLLTSAERAAVDAKACFPLSGQHLEEITAIKDPKQRRRLADVMQALSGFEYLMGRSEIAQLEIEAGIEDALGEVSSLPPLPLVGRSFGWAFGMRGGVKIVDENGNDVSNDARRTMGAVKFDAFMRHANYTIERAMLEGPSDSELPELRANGYEPEAAREGNESRLAYELDLSARLQEHPRWRKGRLRDVVSAREIGHEWLDTLNRVQEWRVKDGRRPFNPGDAEMRQMLAALPHIQVAISIKTAYHRDANYHWTTNDIVDIDAMSVAFAYCDAVFTDKAIRSALASSRDLRSIPTFLPRTPDELADWLGSTRCPCTQTLGSSSPAPAGQVASRGAVRSIFARHAGGYSALPRQDNGVVADMTFPLIGTSWMLERLDDSRGSLGPPGLCASLRHPTGARKTCQHIDTAACDGGVSGCLSCH